MEVFIDVILPLAVAQTYTYRVPDASPVSVQVGMRVLVPFGKRKVHTAIVCSIRTDIVTPPEGGIIKDIFCFLENVPLVTPHQLRLWQWISQYYMCTLGEVMRAALPTALKPESETKVMLNPDFHATMALPQLQQHLLDVLSDGKPKNIDEITRLLDIRTALPSINVLLDMGAICVEEHVEERYAPKTQHVIRLVADFQMPTNLTDKQQTLLRTFVEAEEETLPRHELLKRSGCSAAILKALVDKGVFVDEIEQISRLQPLCQTSFSALHPLNDAQQTALDEIHHSFLTHNTTLLHGVTSSGKTEVYMHLIQEAIDRGQQVLYLVPEIALTTQLTDRLRRVFGDRLGVYHSKFSDQERVEIYRDVLFQQHYDVIIGVRSSLFLPFSRLGLIIMDEEHDASYKQQDPAPRYHARSVAIMLASYFGAKTLLGTATPAVETYFNAQQGKFGLVTLTQRYRGLSLPTIQLVDIKEHRRRKQMIGHFSAQLVDSMRVELGKGKQVIIFQNRRGYANYVECRSCGYVPKCVNCDVSLTEHRFSRTLSCHYCGYTIPIPAVCPNCEQSQSFVDSGFGTEMIEDEVKQLFPDARVARMDLDTTRSKYGHQRLIQQFANHEIDVLIGTQMVTKGLHFDDVSMVAVLRAGGLLNQPDFRAYERAYQMLEQVAGRAGRSGQDDEVGKVIIQANDAENRLYQQVCEHDYMSLYMDQLQERDMFHYPPFQRIICINLRHHELSRLETAARTLDERLKQVFGVRVGNVIVPAIARVQNQYHRQIMLKIERTANYEAAKRLLQQQIDYVLSLPNCKGTTIQPDIDPM
ncbi:MAG: primosomal protein N' [Paludibacteraceae bacterium]|nr:primosomal protein N' [Paludibacteraceae bacterium]